MKRLQALIAIFGLGLLVRTPAVLAQLTPPAQSPVIGARQPALSPDGKRLAFVYRGDIWVAGARGGQAMPVTQHVESDAYPVFSPDGKWIAYASKREGSWDLFAVPTDGGPSRQLTWHGGVEFPGGWSADGTRLLFAAKRESPNYLLLSLNVATFQTDLITEDFAAINYPGYSPDGTKVVYGRYGFPWTRPRYRGSAAAQIYVVDTATGERRRITTDERQHLWPQFLPDGKRILTVTTGEATPSTGKIDEVIPRIEDNPSRTPNLWTFDLKGSGKQITSFTGGGVRWPSVAIKSGDVTFEYGYDLWLLRGGRGKPVKLELLAARDERQNTRRRETLNRDVTEAEPSPDGKTVAFGLRGDLWTIAVDKPKGVAGKNAEFARRLTEWAGEDADFVWAKDGKKLYFISDRQFNARLFELDLETLAAKDLWRRTEDVSAPRLSPDGKQLSFWAAGGEGGLHVVKLEDGEIRRLVKLPGPQWNGIGGGEHEWSPDGEFIAFSQRGENRAWNIYIVPVSGGDAVNVTRLNAFHGSPTWSPDGKYLFFKSNRDGDGIYVLPLTKEVARTEDTDIAFERPKGEVEVKIDFDDAHQRIRKLTSQYPRSDLSVSADGLLLFLAEGDVWSVSYDGKEVKRLSTGGGKTALRVAPDGRRVSYIQNGELWTMRMNDQKTTTKISFTAEWERDVRAERQAAFTQFWRSYHRGFYDANFHGRDWPAIRDRYEPLLGAVETNDEFATLLNMMVGELEASHSEVTAATNNVAAASTPQLGFMFDYTYKGPGIKVAAVPPNAPGSYEKTRINPGDYVLEINGEPVALGEDLYRHVNNKADRLFEFLVNDKPEKDGARTVKYKPLTNNEWEDLIYQNRSDRLRKYVEDKSDGKVGYLHLSAMGSNNQVKFEREAYEYIQGKDAMIIDVRFNRGGNISDTLIDWLERKPHGWFRPRDGAPEPSPSRAWDKPIIVLMNEHSYSNGEMFPDAMRARGLAKIVGMPTPGYVIWTSSMRLVEGTGARMPQSGVFRLDGTPMENLGEKPDVLVPLTTEDWLANRDPQIDKAIEMLLRKGS
ncbi:MAG: S41 family peptidase [Verrucomicrobiota bacterium]